jgi:hypothetical protein
VPRDQGVPVNAMGRGRLFTGGMGAGQRGQRSEGKDSTVHGFPFVESTADS